MTDIAYAQVWADHVVSVGEPGETVTVTVLSGDTVYYGDPAVTSTSNFGSLTVGQSAALTNPATWLRSASQSYVQVTGQAAALWVSDRSAEVAGAGGALPEIRIAPSGDTTGATDTTRIQGAINLLATSTSVGGRVRLLAGVYWITQIRLRSLVEVWGVDRQSTVLRAPLGQALNTHMVVLFSDNEYQWGLWHMTIDGNNGPATGARQQANSFDAIHINSAAAGGAHFGPYQTDMLGVLEDLLVVYSSNDGVFFGGRVPECRVDNVYVHQAYMRGFNLTCQDIFLSNCSSSFPGYDGFTVSGAVIQLANCKSFWAGGRLQSGHKAGFVVQGSNNTLVNCFGQDNFDFGFNVQGAYNRVQGIASGNVTGAVNVFNATSADVQITVGNQNDNAATPTYVLQWDTGTPSAGCCVIVRGDLLNGTSPLNALNTTAGNKVVVGNEDGGHQTIAFAASITPNPYLGSEIDVGTLTAAITINNPSQGHHGSRITFALTQDSTGGRVVTFGANYKTAGAIPTTLSTTTEITFRYDGTNWREVARATA